MFCILIPRRIYDHSWGRLVTPDRSHCKLFDRKLFDHLGRYAKIAGRGRLYASRKEFFKQNICLQLDLLDFHCLSLPSVQPFIFRLGKKLDDLADRSLAFCTSAIDTAAIRLVISYYVR